MDRWLLLSATLLAVIGAVSGMVAVHRGHRSRWTTAWMLLVLICQLGFLGIRGSQREACPLGDRGEILVFLSWSLTLFYLLVGPAYRISLLGVFTAPVVVASWISLQYYGSTVAPEVFGGGNKLIHNVCGGIGVFEGNGGTLRAGLPWQSVHDGEKLMHEPLRLSVCIEAPVEAMTAILARHDDVRALFDNGWLHLFQIGVDGTLAKRYAGNLEWVEFDAPRAPASAKAA